MLGRWRSERLRGELRLGGKVVPFLLPRRARITYWCARNSGGHVHWARLDGLVMYHIHGGHQPLTCEFHCNHGGGRWVNKYFRHICNARFPDLQPGQRIINPISGVLTGNDLGRLGRTRPRPRPRRNQSQWHWPDLRSRRRLRNLLGLKNGLGLGQGLGDKRRRTTLTDSRRRDQLRSRNNNQCLYYWYRRWRYWRCYRRY